MLASARPLLPVVLLLSVSSLNAQPAAVPCEPTPEIRQILRELPPMMRERANALRALRERFPNDLFVHRTYQAATRLDPGGELDALAKEYAELAEKNPGSPMHRFLALNALIGSRTKEAIPHLEQQAKQYPWARMSLVEVYRSPNFRDLSKLRAHLEAFIQACPTNLEAYGWARSVEDPEFAKQAAAKLRPFLQKRTDPDAASAYQTLWMLEFRAAPAAAHERLRKKVAEDVQRLRAASAANLRHYLPALREGYTLIADGENAKWAEEQMKNAPAPSPAMSALTAYDQWSRKNPRPRPDAPAEQRTAYDEALLKASAEWVRQWPDEFSVWMNRANALRLVEKVAAEDVVAAGEAILRLANRSGITMAAHALYVADLYLAKKAGRDRLAPLAERIIAEMESPPRQVLQQEIQNDLYPQRSLPAGLPGADYRRAQWQFSSSATVARIWLELNEKEKARNAVQQMDALLAKLKPSPKADPKSPEEANNQRIYVIYQGMYWERMGRLAEMEQRKVDALAFYQTAMMAQSTPPSAGELVNRTRDLWKELGGTNEGWQAWMTRRAELAAAPPAAAARPAITGSRWTKFDKPLPEFQVTDVRGKKWSVQDFRGKTTFVNFWATW